MQLRVAGRPHRFIGMMHAGPLRRGRVTMLSVLGQNLHSSKCCVCGFQDSEGQKAVSSRDSLSLRANLTEQELVHVGEAETWAQDSVLAAIPSRKRSQCRRVR